MADRTRANQGETVDLVAWRVHGDTDMVEAILDANPGLAALGPILPMGTPVMIPTRAPAKTTPLTLW